MFVRKFSHELLYTILTPMVNFFMWIVALTSVLYLIKTQPQMSASPLPPDADLLPEKPQPRKPHWRVPLCSEAEPMTFHPGLAKVLGYNKAVMLEKIWEWMRSNEYMNRLDHCIDGQWYTYNSAREWQQQHFVWISPETVKRLFQELEEEGYIERYQFHKGRGDCRQWVTIPAKALVLINLICIENAPTPSAQQKTPRGAQLTPMTESNLATLDAKDSPTISESSNKNLQILETPIKKQEEQQQQHSPNESDIETQLDIQFAAAAVEISTDEPQPISGEYSIEGEGTPKPPAKARASSDLVKAMHKDGSNDKPISKVALKVLPQDLGETAEDLLYEMRDTYGTLLAKGHALNLLQQHGEDLLRGIHWYVSSRMDEWRNPVAVLTSMLSDNKLNIAPRRADEENPWIEKDELESLSRRLATESEIEGIFADFDLLSIRELEAREHIPPLPEIVGLNDRPGGKGMTAGEIWSTTHHQLSVLFDRPSYDMWLKNAYLLGYQDTVFRIAVPSANAQDMLQHRYYRNVQRVFEGLSNIPVTLEFEVHLPLAPYQQPLSVSERDELHRLRESRALL